MKSVKIACVVAIIFMFSFVGFGIRSSIFKKRANQLTAYYAAQQVQLSKMQAQTKVFHDDRVEKDKSFLDTMFDDIFTFYDIDGFNAAKQSAIDYNLPNAFIMRMYDKSELINSAYAEQMLHVICKYDSSTLYLLDKKDDVYYYMATVDLSLVEYNSNIKLVLFIELVGDGDVDERVKSMVYYTTK